MKKKIFSIWSVLLVLVVSIAVLVPGCDDGVEKYDLTMAANPAADCGTATDETDGSPYAANATVNIKAVAAACCRFVDWTVSAGEVGNATAAETTFIMPARAVTVTANFELKPPDHYKFYTVDWEEGLHVGKDVELVDQFHEFGINATVGYPISFGNPVEKGHGDEPTPIADMNRHYTLYELDYGEEGPMLDSWQVVVNNQFGNGQELTVYGPLYLAVPTQKEDHEMVECLNHYLVYMVDEADYHEFDPVEGVNLKDQFILDGEDVTVKGPHYFANPVKKTVVGGDVAVIEDPDLHWVLYGIWDAEAPSIKKSIQIDNQFGKKTIDLTYRDTLAVPSQKKAWEQPLDHFHCYWADWGEDPPETFPAIVELEDQFITEWLDEPLIAEVGEPVHFANPVNKEHGKVWTPVSNWNDHYTFYELEYFEMPPIWYVQFSNQFDPVEPGYQALYVSGPDYLAVPTQKGDQDPPVNLDHFLVYNVYWEWTPPHIGIGVYLQDQFTDYETTLHEVAFFANPVKKIDATGVTAIMHPDDHLVGYWITATGFPMIEDLPIDNQFGPQFLNVGPGEGDLLAVPSEKIVFYIVVD